VEKYINRIRGAIGATDCTHFQVLKPTVMGDEYINRKGFPSINVQATVNAREMFTSVDASWPGSVHDSRIWKNSDIFKQFRNMTNNNTGAFLLADSGYGLSPWLLTPYRNPNTAIQQHFNDVHKTDRVTVERVFGQLQSRFPMTHYIFRIKLDRVPRAIVSSMVLHNAAKYLIDPQDFEPVQHEHIILNYNQAQNNVRLLGEARRNHVANNL
jgi:hypothetical protein